MSHSLLRKSCHTTVVPSVEGQVCDLSAVLTAKDGPAVQCVASTAVSLAP